MKVKTQSADKSFDSMNIFVLSNVEHFYLAFRLELLIEILVRRRNGQPIFIE
jgi:hypothetical protein